MGFKVLLAPPVCSVQYYLCSLGLAFVNVAIIVHKHDYIRITLVPAKSSKAI